MGNPGAASCTARRIHGRRPHGWVVSSWPATYARVLQPGGRFLCFLNHPLLQAPGSGWIDDHILEEQYWRVGPYLVENYSATRALIAAPYP